MRPDTSRWRDAQVYDFYDNLDPEGLAWECLRRDADYQRHYGALIRDKGEKAPLAPEAEDRWGLRFRGPTQPIRSHSGCTLVAVGRSRGSHAGAGAAAVRSDRDQPA